jgi:hypothetical protein
MTQADQAGAAREVLADVHERLVSEFAEMLEAGDVLACVTKAHHELDVVPAAALPELLERLARVRLRGRVERAAQRAAGATEPGRGDVAPAPRPPGSSGAPRPPGWQSFRRAVELALAEPRVTGGSEAPTRRSLRSVTGRPQRRVTIVVRAGRPARCRIRCLARVAHATCRARIATPRETRHSHPTAIPERLIGGYPALSVTEPAPDPNADAKLR